VVRRSLLSIQLAPRGSPDALVAASGVPRARWSSVEDECFVRPNVAVLTIELATWQS
jgi:hypothetical protein